MLLSLGTPGYLTALGQMRNALRQRNAALRRGRAHDAAAFDAPFAAAASQVAAMRRHWVQRWSERFGDLCRALGETAEPRLAYAAHRRPAEGESDALLRELGAALERDLRRGATTVGPHRDDLTMSLAGADLRRYGSSGQQRTAAVALRLLEAESLAEDGRVPIALYDDVFAELDGQRQANLLALIQRTLPGQVIVTAPRDSEVPAGLLDRPRWGMCGGRIAR